nr:Chain C, TRANSCRIPTION INTERMEDIARY FACTOR-2 [Homo sapiens]1GWR_D Chain D, TRANSCRIPTION INTERMEDIARY FACTOR-2 [Homo sapiens]
NALLRYLLD